MKPIYILPFLIVCVTGCEERIKSVRLPKVDVPEEPLAAPWSPPKTKLPKAVVEEASFLLSHSLGDPRGGDYRNANVVIGSVWGGDATPTTIHGWVLKGRKRVVAPNGLLYDAVEIGAPADLKADLQEEIERWNVKDGSIRRFPRSQGPFWGPITVRVLLVAGKVGFAEQYHAALPKNQNGEPPAATNGFLSAKFDQAVTAHMRGDDATALRVGRSLLQHREAFEKEGLRINGVRLGMGPGGRPVETNEQFSFLQPLPDLVSDTEQRLSLPAPAFDIKSLPKDQDERVTALVQALDQVSARQWSQPGGVNLAEDPIVVALIAEDDAAVEPLLTAMESDNRLTRSVSFGRDFHPARNLITVRSAAFAAFRGIAQMDELPSGEGGRPSVTALRQYWKSYGGKSATDRWFDTLADDTAGKRQWEEAVTRLFDRVGTQRSGSWSTIRSDGPAKAKALRKRSNPSLSDLLEQRAREIAASDPQYSRTFYLGPAVFLATKLGEWDPPRSRPVLRDLTREALDQIASGKMQFQALEGRVVTALDARAKAGDSETWPDYVAFLGKIHGLPYQWDSKAFRPVAEHLETPGMRAAAVSLFTDPTSDWNWAMRLRRYGGAGTADPVVYSPLLRLPELRGIILDALKDPTPIGSVWVDANGTINTEIGEQRSGRGGSDVSKDPLRPKPHVRLPYRVKDNVALVFERLQGGPKFQIYWPLKERDAAIRQLSALLTKEGEHVVDRLGWPNDWQESPAMRRALGR